MAEDRERSTVREDLLDAAVRIGDELLAGAERGAEGWAWPSLVEDFRRRGDEGPEAVRWKVFDGLYVGSAGVAVFLMELAGRTRDRRYLDAAEAGLDRAAWGHRQSADADYGLYLGRMGTAWALIQLHSRTGDDRCLERALSLARGAERFFDLPGVRADLLYGVSGAVLGLLHLHAATGEAWLLRPIQRGVGRLLDLAHPGPEGGVYWQRSRSTIHGLTGFSHGASGVAFTLLELAHHLGWEDLVPLAEEGLRYERCWYDPERENWLDLRKGIWNEDDYRRHRPDVLAGKFEFFEQPFEMVGWCNGAAGIGLTRLRAWELTGRAVWLDEARAALRKSAEMAFRPSGETLSGTLCHGSGGIAETFLEAHRVLGEDGPLRQAERVGMDILEARSAMGFYLSGVGASRLEDPTLFMGNAGIGHFFLRVLDPAGVPSILAPRVDATTAPAEPTRDAGRRFDRASIGRRVLAEPFRHTLGFLDRAAPETARALLATPLDAGCPLQERFARDLEKRLPDLEGHVAERTADALELDRARVAVDRSVTSHSLLHIQSRILLERGEALVEDGLGDTELVLSPGAEIVICKWPWPELPQGEADEALERPAGEHPVLLVPRALEVSEQALSGLEWLVLVSFGTPATVAEAVRQVREQVEIAEEGQEQLAAAVVAQVEEALRAGLLMDVELGWHPAGEAARVRSPDPVAP